MQNKTSSSISKEELRERLWKKSDFYYKLSVRAWDLSYSPNLDENKRFKATLLWSAFRGEFRAMLALIRQLDL